jgi:dipeptidyl aminopeptidase/acylaminoacyl peptidase
MHGIFLAVSVALAAGGLGPSAPSLSLGDMARIVDLEEPAISPDARHVALVVVTQDRPRDAYDNDLAVIDVRTGRMQVVAFRHEVAVPRWSPDGSRLAYLARPSQGLPLQLFVREGGANVRLTHARGDVSDAAWSPDGREVAFVAADPPSTAPFFFAGDNDYTASSLTPPEHLWIVSASGGKARRITSGSWTIAPTDPGGIFSPQIAWTSDGRSITFTRLKNTFSGDDEYSTLWQVEVANAAMHKLTARSELELSPSYAPDGSHLAYWYPLGGDFNAENTVRVIGGGGDATIAPSLDRNIAASLWFPDSKRLLLCGSDGTQTRFWTADLTGAVQLVPLGDLHPVCDPYSSSTFDSGSAAAIARDGTIAFVATTSATARELYVLPFGSTKPRRLTHVNGFLAGLRLGHMSELRWTGPADFAEDGVVTDPAVLRQGPVLRQAQDDKRRKYPIVVLIHGGPGLSNSRDFVWEQWPLAQMIAAHGYVVFQPNYRGSDNLGNAYMTAIVHDTVAGPSDDIMSGLAALERRPDVDASRVAVCGWSYGGELTSWLIGHYHNWRAAVSGAAVNSEFDEYNLSTSNVQDRYPLGTSPYSGDGERIYRENSPITYYAQITTPTLLWGTTLDPVVPITQSYALYHALVDNHIPVRFAVFPAATHGPNGPKQTAELTRLWLDWLDEHLR